MRSINKPPFFFKKKNLDSFVAALLGFCVLYLFTSYNGIGVSPDSVIYSSVAKSVQSGKGFTEFDRMPMTMFPFFYPFFLACISFLTHVDVIKMAPCLNSFLFAIVIYVSGWIMEKFIHPFKYYKWMVLATIITAPCLLEVFSLLWSETVFTLLILLFFIAAKSYFLSGNKLKDILLFALIAALATITRFAGITLIAAGTVFLLLENTLSWKKKSIHLIIFLIVSFSLLIGNLIRNKTVSGGFTGHRLKSITPLLINWRYYGNVMYSWLQLHLTDNNGYLIIGTSVFIFAGIFLINQILHKRYQQSYENMAAIFFVVYISFIVFSATVSRYEPINNRLLEPAYIPFLWSASYYIPLLIRRLNNNKRALGISIFLTLAALFLYEQVLTVKQMYKDVLDDGIAGYTSKSYQQSPIIKWIKTKHNTLNPVYPVYSNVNDCMYFFSGVAAQAIPDAARQEEIKEYLNAEPHYIIWFGGEEIINPNKFSLKTIQQYRHLDTLQQLEDGGVYFCKPYKLDNK